MKNYLNFLCYVYARCNAKNLTNLSECADFFGISHNASIVLGQAYLNFVKKRKDGTYKWRKKPPKKRMAEDVIEYVNIYTNFKKRGGQFRKNRTISIICG